MSSLIISMCNPDCTVGFVYESAPTLHTLFHFQRCQVKIFFFSLHKCRHLWRNISAASGGRRGSECLPLTCPQASDGFFDGFVPPKPDQVWTRCTRSCSETEKMKLINDKHDRWDEGRKRAYGRSWNTNRRTV